MNDKNLREYIRHVYILEKTLYEQNTLIRSLKWEINNFSKDEKIMTMANTNGSYKGKNPVDTLAWYDLEDKTPYKRIKDQKEDSATYFSSEGFGILFFISLAIGFIGLFFSNSKGSIFNKLFSTLWFGIKVAFFAFIILIAIYAVVNLIRFLINRSKCNKDNQDVSAYNAEIIKNNKIAYNQRLIQQKNMIAEVNYLRDVSMKKTRDTLMQLYSADIIFPKYRNLVAISSFYEYLESGRCSTLTGHEGAYNIFENEIRLNHIIQQLDIVIKKLDEIKNNQYMLYDAIKESQKQNDKIVREIKSIKNQNIDIMHNTSISAYNSSIIAQNTEVIKWYNIFNS